MSRLQEILNRLMEISQSPQQQLKHYLDQGRQVVGCFPPYTPEELADAAGMVPMGVWGSSVEPYLAKAYLPSFCCPIMQSNLEMGLNGTLNGLTAVLIPTVCDALRCITQNWRAGVADITMIPVTYPQNRGKTAEIFLCSEYQKILDTLEQLTGYPITEEALDQSLKKYNDHNHIMMEFTQVANDHLDVITPVVRHSVMKSAWFMDKTEHTQLVTELVKELSLRKCHTYTGKKVLLTGIISEPMELLTTLEKYGIAVVGDDLAHSSRQYRTLIPEGGSALNRLAAQWTVRTCSMIHDTSKKRLYNLCDMAKITNATGVIACMMKFCDPEEYDLPLMRQLLLKADIPLLDLELDMQAGNTGQLSTRVETFAEMI